MKPALTLLPCLALLALGCSSGTSDRGVLPQAPVSVLVGGSITREDRTEALYWKDGTAVPLVNEAGIHARVTGLAASGSDVYAVGGHSGHPAEGAVWKNGVLTLVQPPLHSPDPSFTGNPALAGIAVAGQDVYVAGTIFTNSPYSLAVAWKNGAGTVLGGGSVVSRTSAIFAKGSDVYVAGWDGSARYWKNGVAHGLGSSTGIGEVEAVAVTDAGEVLAVGYTVSTGGVQMATLWRNGEPVFLSDGLKGASAAALAVAGTDVYAAGYVVTGTTRRAAFWKNGVQTLLPATAGSSSGAYGIAPYGSDLYIVGYEDRTAVLWKNGTEIPLTDGRDSAWASSICLVHP
ncbi:hypothetical protein [Mesoterricola silvestris]|uniref:Uncharacterized protein n=1 Tax=Mesoterricola silvestris TaxID=2927979 RepID=A0AA48K7L8_9BACT|nr:hypothetical protein [Mesoterricola silvestris]BDU71270.1 hypothetical protein METEAL_04440 [Mesoterricola silvestris]